MANPSYAVSAYLAPPGHDGLIFNRHDHAIALWRVDVGKIHLVRYWQLERISGQKHHDWPILALDDLEEFVDSLLADVELCLSDVTWAWGLPFRDDDGMLESFASEMNISSHALCHLFSALLLDSRVMTSGTVLAMAVDGGPDYVRHSRVPEFFYAGAVADHGHLEIFPVESAGQIYEAVSQFYGMEPGTLMAAAGICSCTVDVDVRELVRGRRYDNRRGQMNIAPATIAEINERCRTAFRVNAATRCGDARLTAQEHFLSAVMKHVQAASTVVAERNVERILERYGVDPSRTHLAIGGGFALNCPTNSALLKRFGFRGLLIPPAADDSGQALGIGLAEMYLRGLFDDRHFDFGTAYHGPRDIALEAPTADSNDYEVSEFDLDCFVSDITRGPVAWVDGRSEIGPRALGHRSLLADPRRIEHRDILNEIKERQWWRPVAPIVLEDRAAQWFDRGHRSPYMLETWDVLPDKREVVPAIVHLDGSARVQTLRASDNPRLFSAIAGFARATGVPIICNTSLNAKGEPIVETVPEAIRFCQSRGVEVLYVAGRRLTLKPAAAPPHEPLPRSSEVFVRQEQVLGELWADLAAQGVTPEMLFLVAGRPEFKPMLFEEDGRRRLAELMPFVVRADPDNADRAARFAQSRGPRASFGLQPLQRYVPKPAAADPEASPPPRPVEPQARPRQP